MNTEVTDRELLGVRIKRLRKERNISQHTLASACSITDSWLSQVEHDKVTASPALLNRIAEVLKVPIRELLQNEDEHMEMVSRLKLVEVLLETGQANEAEPIIWGLKVHPEITEADALKLQVYLAEVKYQQKRYDESLGILTPLSHKLELANFHDAYILACIRNQMGKAYLQKQDVNNAYYSFRKGYEYTNRFPKFDSLSAHISYNVGITLRRIGLELESILYLERAHEYYRENNDLKKLADTIFVQGLIYKSMQDYPRAAECFSQAKAIFHGLNQRTLSNMVEIVVASSITAEKDPNLALEEINKCLSIYQEDRNFAGLLNLYTKMASVQIRVQRFSEARKSLDFANELISEQSLTNIPEIGEYYKIEAKTHFNNKNFDTSKDFALKSSELFGNIGLVRDQVDSLQLAVDAYQELGEFKEALTLERECNKLLVQLHEGR